MKSFTITAFSEGAKKTLKEDLGILEKLHINKQTISVDPYKVKFILKTKKMQQAMQEDQIEYRMYKEGHIIGDDYKIEVE